MKEFADLVRAGTSRRLIETTLGLTSDQYFYRLRKMRKQGIVPVRTELNALAWAEDRHRVGAGPRVGSKEELLQILGVDMLRRIAAEVPPGVTLMGWLAAIVKDAMNEEPVQPAATAVRQLDAGAAGRSAQA